MNFLISTEQRLCETGFMSDIAGYRKLYGDCVGVGDLELGFVATLDECTRICDERVDCAAFSFVNPPVFQSLGRPFGDATCILKSTSFSETALVANNPGIFSYFKGLLPTGKSLYYTLSTCDIIIAGNFKICHLWTWAFITGHTLFFLRF